MKKKNKRAAPEVVEFCEPGTEAASTSSCGRKIKRSKRRKKACRADFDAFMSGSLTKIRGRVYKGKSEEEKSEIKERTARHALWKKVSAIGAMSMRGKEKWQWEQERLKELGFKGAKNRKTPIKILTGIRRKEKWKSEKHDAEIRASGVVVAKKKKKDDPRSSKKSKGSQNFNHHYSLNGGHFGGGVLKFRSDPTKRRRR